MIRNENKKVLAALVTCVFAFAVCAVPALAKVIPTVPGENASVALEVINLDNTECNGNIKQLDAQMTGNGMTVAGDYIKYQAESPVGYLFDSWTVNLFLVKQDGSRQELGAAYQDDAGQLAFTNSDGSAAYDANDPTLRVNYVVLQDFAQGQEHLEYQVTANFKKDPSSVGVSVRYVYNGVYGDNIIYEETQYLAEGTHTINAQAANYENLGYELVDAAANSQEVNVTNDGGQLTADVNIVNFYVQPTVDPTTVSFQVTYVDLAGNPIAGGGDIFFDDIGVYERDNIILPYGYRAIPPAHPGEDWFYPTSLEYINGQWQATVPNVEIIVAKSVATVNIQFALEDGTLLPELSYEKSYLNVGSGIETVEAPEGYEIVGNNTYAVEVTEDSLLNLVADPTEVTFTVRPVEAPVTTGYEIIQGANSVWNKGNTEGLTIASNGDFTKFTGIKVDGTEVGTENYTAVSGSTVVTLNASYLNGLAEGTHTLTMVYTDGEVSTQFTVGAQATGTSGSNTVSPQTGDSNHVVLWSSLAIAISGAIAGTLFLVSKKKAK